LRDIHGNIPFTEIFRPIPENEMITIKDKHGNEWTKIYSYWLYSPFR